MLPGPIAFSKKSLSCYGINAVEESWASTNRVSLYTVLLSLRKLRSLDTDIRLAIDRGTYERIIAVTIWMIRTWEPTK